MENTENMVVLLVEDDPGDQKLTKLALMSGNEDCDVHIAASGEDGLQYLSQSCEGNPQNPRPRIILLDLNMPGMGGKEFLRLLKADDMLKDIPVVILSTSGAELDIEECYRLQASGYIQKPTSPTEFQNAIGKFTKYWSMTLLTVKA
ncbi:MAG: response regulator [Phycisphaerae bacterium]|nr:response regulator [Phycisphaerae bacterium]